MLKNLKLTNFQQHTNLTVDFTPGLNAVRGANEAGKSSLFNAIAYAYWGARALPMSLEDTVTWGQPVSTLKVEHTFSHMGQDYSIVRRKSGAELLGPDGLRVSGNAEVTLYMEALFRANMSVASATLIANQGELKGSLDGSAVALIEKLSNMALIDQLVDKAQANLPNGNTKIFEGMLEGLAHLVQPVADFTALQATVTNADAAEFAATDAAEVAAAHFKEVEAEAQAAGQRLADVSVAAARRRTLQSQLEQAVAASTIPAPVPTVQVPLGDLLASQEAQASAALTAVKWQAFQALPTVPVRYSRAGCAAQKLSAESALMADKASIRQKELARATALAMLITQSGCGLCGKDLTDIPEVAVVNAKATATADALSAEISELSSAIERHNTTLVGIAALVRADHQQEVKLSALTGYVDVDNSYIPSVVKLSGQPVLRDADTTDYAKLIALRRKEDTALAVHASQVDTAQGRIESLKLEIAAVPALEADPKDSLAAPAAAAARADAQAAMAALHAAQQALGASNYALRAAEQAHRHQVELYEAGIAKRAELTATLASYAFNNRLIKKLREVRPVVASRLWGTVLSAVSTYFSSIRGTQSLVTRDDSRFLVDGKPIAAYSGSTKDALGLAIRVTLQKTFLGEVGFMLVDEPAAASDATRETAMLGMLATCGYGQVILVTHSDLADSFAANIVRI